MRVSQDERERHRYLERQRALRDAASLAEDARVARQVGFDQGIEKGELAGSIRLLQQILALPQTPREELLPLSVDELRRLAEGLQRQRTGDKQTNGTPPNDQT